MEIMFKIPGSFFIANFHLFSYVQLSPYSSVGILEDLVRRDCWFDSPAPPTFFPRIDDSNKIYFSLSAVHCFDNGYVGKQPVA